MTLDEVKDWLYAWGRWYGERPTPDDPEAFNPDVHPIARGMRFAPGKRSEVIRQRSNMDRGGMARRYLMGQAANAGLDGASVGFNAVPARFVDPVPARETRPSVYGLGEISRPVPLQVQRIERHALDLRDIEPVLGVCLRTRYCRLGMDAEKADAASAVLRDERVLPPDGALSVNSFRDAVGQGRLWMWGRLSAPDGLSPR